MQHSMIKKLASYEHFWVTCHEKDHRNPEGPISGSLNNVCYEIQRGEKTLVSGPIVQTLEEATSVEYVRVPGTEFAHKRVEVPRYPCQTQGPVSTKEVERLRAEGKVKIVPNHSCLMPKEKVGK